MSALLLSLVLAQADVPIDAAGTWADPTRTLAFVPGARELLSGASPVSLDGLQPAASMLLFDGVAVRFPAHGLFGPSTLPAAWLAGVSVSGAAGATESGRSLGRSVTLLPRAQADGWHGSARLDVLTTGVSVSGVVPTTGTRLQAAARFFTAPALAASLFKVRALLGDWQVRVEQPLEGGALRLLALGAADDAALTVSGIPLAARVVSQTADLRWRDALVEAGLSAGHESVLLSLRGAQTRNDLVGGEQTVGGRFLFRPAIGAEVTLTFGADAQARRLVLSRASETAVQVAAASTVASASKQVLGVAVTGGFLLEARDAVGPFRWSVGVRGDGWRPLSGVPLFALDPRVSLERDLGDAVRLSASAGLRHQPATWLVPMPVLDTAAWSFGLQQAVVGDLAARVTPAPHHRLDARVFGTSLRQTIELSPLDDTFLPEATGSAEDVARRAGSGWAAGGSLAWRFTPGDALWVDLSYSLVTSWRLLTISRYGLNGLPSSEVVTLVPWSFDQTHQLRGLTGWRFEHGWAVSATITLQSGAPLAGGLFSQEQREGVDPVRNTPRWVPLDRDLVGRASPWLRVDARASKTWRPAPLELELFLDVQNLSVWAQPTGTSYGVDAKTGALTTKPASSPLGFPIPVLGVEARL